METALLKRRPLFWDINEKDIEFVLNNSVDWVIQRVFEYGSIQDIAEVIKFYGKERVRKILTLSKMKPMTRAMAYLFLEIDIEGKYVV